MNFITPVMPPEQVYAAAMDSADVIKALSIKSVLTEEDRDAISRNVGHLQLTVIKDIWTTEDLAPFHLAIEIGLRVLGT